MLLSFVVPCFNEAGNIFRFFNAVKSAFSLRSETLEFVFVDDGSSDATFSELKQLFDENPEEKIRVLSFSRNFGKEAAMYAGLKNASGDYVCVIDADLQQRPETVIEMLEILENNSDTDSVAAYRKERNGSRFSSFVKSSFYKIIDSLSDIEFFNGASDFRLMRRPVVEAALSLTEKCRFSKGIFSFVGFNTVYIPYSAAKREVGRSKWSFFSLMRYALDGILAFSTKPLLFSLLSGVLSLLAFLVCLIIVLTCGGDVFSPAAAVVVSLLLGGVFLVSSGILGAYVAKVYAEVKNRPVYIIKTQLYRENENEKN